VWAEGRVDDPILDLLSGRANVVIG